MKFWRKCQSPVNLIPENQFFLAAPINTLKCRLWSWKAENHNWGWFCPRGHWAISGDTLVITTWRYYRNVGVEARDTAEHLMVQIWENILYTHFTLGIKQSSELVFWTISQWELSASSQISVIISSNLQLFRVHLIIIQSA